MSVGSTDRSRAGHEEVGEAAVAVDARERAVDAVHVVAGAARPAQPAGDVRMHDHRVADLDVGHRRADLVHPAGVLVPGRVGQLHPGLLGPLALLDVEVGAAQPGRADLDDDVERADGLRLVDLVEPQRLVVRVQAGCLWAKGSPAGRGGHRKRSTLRRGREPACDNRRRRDGGPGATARREQPGRRRHRRARSAPACATVAQQLSSRSRPWASSSSSSGSPPSRRCSSRPWRGRRTRRAQRPGRWRRPSSCLGRSDTAACRRT